MGISTFSRLLSPKPETQTPHTGLNIYNGFKVFEVGQMSRQDSDNVLDS